jgi:hypothetical protein
MTRPPLAPPVERVTPAGFACAASNKTDCQIPSLIRRNFDAISAPRVYILELGMSRSLAPSVLLVLLTASFAADKKRDFHLDQDTARDLYLHSAFAHGLRHGYEEGFHAADLDIHTAAPRKALDKLSRVPKTIGYRREFGDKKSFRRGYEYGYVAGYDDSFENRKFHYLAPSDVTNLEPATADFDIGVASGYTAVFHSGSDYARCDRDAPAYCAGFQTGSALALAERHASDHQVASGGAPKR